MRRLQRLMETGSPAENRLHEVETIVSSAFDALLNHDLESSEDLLGRVDYLLKLIRATHPDDSILQRMVDTLWKDIVLLQARQHH
ncbi:MAG: hypothetical protein HRU27_00275 [Rhizobiaceae bacterium]|nr:hypothetical protein [Hyphomicrobiales bacterium]NRB29010.1 hypothetical protein [Rhizobiaceae bacterium]